MTLDEVIKANKCCDHGEPDSRCEDCPYNGIGACCAERESDALHYLREYRKKLHILEVRMTEYKRGFEQLGIEWSRITDNPPLTWDELREMRCQPVWFEVLDHQSLPLLDSWTITTGTPYKSWQGVESMAFIRPGASYSVPVADYGRTWITYRKERI